MTTSKWVVYCIGEYDDDDRSFLENAVEESIHDFGQLFRDARDPREHIMLNFGGSPFHDTGHRFAGQFLFVGLVELFVSQLKKGPENRPLSSDDYARRSKGVSLHELIHMRHYSNIFPELEMVTPEEAVKNWDDLIKSYAEAVESNGNMDRLMKYLGISEAIANYGAITWYDGLDDDGDREALKSYVSDCKRPHFNVKALEAIYELHDSATGYTWYTNPALSRKEVERKVLKLVMPKITRAKGPVHLKVICSHYSANPGELAKPVDWQ
jgi:hypothetical protein